MDSDGEDYYQDSDCEDQASDGSDTNEPDYSSATRKPYKILTDEDIKHLLENDISEVSDVLSVPRGVACALLCRNNWSLTTAYDTWFASVEERNPNPSPAMDRAAQGSTDKICKICYEYPPPEKMVSATCGHPFCVDCWKHYIATAVSDGAGCLTLLCPEPRCREAAISEIVEKLSSEDVINKYHQYLRRSYVESSRKRKWCPAPGCDRAVELDGGESDSHEVACDCSYRFCWRCAEERHRPLSCEAMAEWAEMNRSEAENTTWIIAYTKPCPKCRRPIEKNQGCNHMTCGAPCHFEFCWICAAPWEEHGYSDVACNRYTDDQRQREAEDKGEDEDAKRREKARRFIRRYSHYYERWDSNNKARKRAMADLERAREKYGGKVGLQFLVEAWEQIVECRHVLKCSYVYGYFLQAEGAKKALFEYLQGQAEAELERLHHCVEKEIVDEGLLDIVDEGLFYVDSEEFTLFRAKLLNLTKVVSNYFQNLVVGLENDLSEPF